MEKSRYNSRGKQLVLNYFIENPDKMLSTEDVYNALIQQHDSINLTTVYRNLEKLVDENLIMAFVSDDRKKSTYKFVGEQSSCNDHLHLLCTECGKVIHLDCNFMDEIAAHISDKHDFDLKCSNSIIYGICKECKSKNK